METYLYDFDREIYGEEIRVQLLAFRRPELHFPSVDALRAQLLADMDAGREYARENIKIV